MTDDALDAVLARISERVTPDAEERARLDEAVDRLTDATERALADRSIAADVVHVGSSARGTWLPGDRDIDLFVRFPPDLPREDLERHGLAVGHDLVPCFRVESATEIRSAVDRTPFHTRYLDSRLDAGLAADVRLAKAFLSAIGVYGSDLRTRGFSGYLVELLTLEHGGFRSLIEAAADWRSPVRFDPEDHGDAGNEGFDDPLVVVDPTDPGRNVAAVLSTSNLARFQHYARDLLADLRESAFVAATGVAFGWLAFLLATPVQVVLGRQFYANSYTALVRNRRANMDVLIALGSSTAYLYSVAVLADLVAGSVYFDTAALILVFITLGNYLEARSKGQASEALRRLLEMEADTATLIDGEEEREVPVEDVAVGDRLRVRPGERIPTDGVG
ncbi:MAG: hypothetical protein BRD24_09925, partial [Halobacteriales archaeon SW_9_67_24]